MDSNFNFASLYEYLAETIHRLPDDQLGSAIGMYFGRHQTIARTTRSDLSERGEFVIEKTDNGFSCEKSENHELRKLQEHKDYLQKQLESVNDMMAVIKSRAAGSSAG